MTKDNINFAKPDSDMSGQTIAMTMTPQGIGLRDWFAGHALVALLNDDSLSVHETKHVPTACYLMADAMLAAREVQS